MSHGMYKYQGPAQVDSESISEGIGHVRVSRTHQERIRTPERHNHDVIQTVYSSGCSGALPTYLTSACLRRERAWREGTLTSSTRA